jgi:hypothetical protein
VRAILHLEEEQVLTEKSVVQRREAGLFVELRDALGIVIGERLLPKEGSCEELAQAAAVVLSAWLSDVHPDFAPGLPVPEPLPALGEEEQQPPPTASPPSEPPPRDAPLRPIELRPARSFRSLPNRRRWQLDAGAGVGVIGGEPSLAGSLGASWVPARGWGVRAGVLVDAVRRAELDPGSVRWRRWPLSVGPTWCLSTDAVELDLTVAPALSWLRVSGADFEPVKTQSDVTWALAVDARVASRAALGWFAAASGQVYLGESTAFAGAAEYALPRLVVTLLVGARLNR